MIKESLLNFKSSYKDKISIYFKESKDLVEGKIHSINKDNIILEINQGPTIKVEKKQFILMIIQIFLILNKSYLLINRNEKISNQIIKEWLKKRLKINESFFFKIRKVKEEESIDIKESINYFKWQKFFLEINYIRLRNKKIKGLILRSLKGGFSTTLGGLMAFLPGAFLLKKRSKKRNNSFLRSVHDFKISKINRLKKNIVLKKN